MHKNTVLGHVVALCFALVAQASSESVVTNPVSVEYVLTSWGNGAPELVINATKPAFLDSVRQGLATLETRKITSHQGSQGMPRSARQS